MKSKKILLLILILFASVIPEARALTPQSQTLSITDTHDDAFITEVGILIDSSLVTILDPNMDIRSFLVFRELDINYWEPLTNATLRLHTSTTLAFDADSSVTIYGMKISELQDSLPLTPSNVLSIGYTSAHVDYNTSEFDGQQWHEIDVSEIVDELIRNPNWDGDGNAGTETGDSIGFHIVGAEGSDKRYFYDFSVGNGLEAQLVLHWNHEPPPPVAGAHFIEIHGDNYTIWYHSGGWLNFSTFTVIGVDKTGGLNDTWFQLTNFYDDTQGWFRRNFTDDGFGTYNVKFGIKWEALPWNGPAAYEWYGFWGVSSDHQVFHSFGEGYSTQGRTWSDRAAGTAWSHTGGGLSDSHSVIPQYMEVDLSWTLYFNISLDFNTRTHIHEAYNDIDMTDLNLTTTKVYATGPVYSVGLFVYEYLFGPSILADQDTGITCEYISRLDMGEYIVTDENGTIVERDFETLEDAEDWIETEDTDPEDPNPGGEWDTGPFSRFRTRFYVLIIGMVLLIGPLFYFAYQRPSGYEFVIGCFIMFVGISLMIAAGSI